MSGSEAEHQVAPNAVITKLSPWSVGETVARLSAIVAAMGMKRFALVDHSGKARSVGLRLRDTKLVIFGSPEAGPPVMEAAPLAALDLPLKVVVWLDGHQTKLSYTAPSHLAARHRLPEHLAQRLAGLDSLTANRRGHRALEAQDRSGIRGRRRARGNANHPAEQAVR